MTARKLSLSIAALLAMALPAGAQRRTAPPRTDSPGPPTLTQPDLDRRSAAYFEFTVGRFYEELYESSGRSDYANQAIAAYKKAFELDPRSPVIGERLAETYAKAQRIREAVLEAQEILKTDPDNLPARRILARIYIRTLGEVDTAAPERETVGRAIEQYREIVRLDPDDVEAALWLARLYRVRQETAAAEKVLRGVLEREPEQPDALRQLAQLLIDGDRPNEAVELLTPLVKRSPGTEWLVLLGEASLRARDAAAAERSCRQALAGDADSLPARKCLAQALLIQEKLEAALEQYQRLAELEPNEPQNFLRQALIYRRLRKLDKAEEALLRAKQGAPGSLEVIYNEALTYRAQGRFQDAIRVLTDAIAATKASSVAAENHSTLGILYEQVGMLYREVEDYSSAIDAFQQMRQLGREEERRARELLIDTYRMDKQIEPALDETRKAIRDFPDDNSFLMTYALLLVEKGETDQGAALLRKQLHGTADDFELQLTIAQVYERSRRYPEAEEATRAAEKLAARQNEREMVWFLLAEIRDRQKKFGEAEALFRKLLEVNPRNASVLNYYGYMLAERGERLDEAVAMIQRALEEDSFNGAYLDSLGWAYFKQNRLEEAETYLRKAVERTAQDPTIRDHLGDVYFRMGRARQAAVEWEKSLEFWRHSLPSDYEPDRVAEVGRKLEAIKRSLAQKAPGEAKQ